jgi:biopolymer transport protein ExbB
VELARNEAERRKEQISAELRRGMSIVATVGSIAPFVGLLGTVVGIIAAFQGIGASGSGGIGAVSSGIAEALVETAFGLMVAIPAVIMFNWLTSRVAIIELTLARSTGELLDEMESHRGGVSERHAQAAAE